MVRGFTLLELLVALSITLGIGLAGFQLFMQNERVFLSQHSASETEQNARAVGFQIADEIRRAGQGVAVYASRFDALQTEEAAIVLNGSDSTRLRIREGFSNAETSVVTTPVNYEIGVPVSVIVENASVFYAALSTTAPHGRFVYIWGSGSLSCWSWIRGELTAIDSNARGLTLIPRQGGESCRTAPDTVRFTSTQTLSLEEAVSIYFASGSVWRASATDTASPVTPAWGSASELGREITELEFTYFDEAGQPVSPSTLVNRLAVRRIDVRLRNRSGFSLTLRSAPRNAGLH